MEDALEMMELAAEVTSALAAAAGNDEENNEKRHDAQRREPAESGSMQRAGSVPGIIFAVSNDGGKTGVAWRENVHDALAYLDLQNVGGRGYCVVAVRKVQNEKLSDGGPKTL